MNFNQIIELERELSIKLDRPINLRSLDNYYAYQRQFNDRSIKLHRDHIPINPKVCLNRQIDYDYYIEGLLYLRNLLDNNVINPTWLVTLHYTNDMDYIKPIKETDNPFGYKDRYGYKCFGDLWKQNINSKRHKNLDHIYPNARKILNLVLKYLYGIKRLNQTWKKKHPNLLFFHELGKVKLNYHTHLILPKTDLFKTKGDQQELQDIFNTSIKERCKSMNKFRKVDVQWIEPEDKYSVVGYLNKESKVTTNHLSLDPYNSLV